MNTKSLEELESSIPTKDFILGACANLVTVDQYIRFVHFSVQEFLTSNRATTLNMEYEVAHREIAQTCIIFLALSPNDSGSPAQLHEYASKEWPHHLLAGNLNKLPVDDQMVTLTLPFLEKSPWLRIEHHAIFRSGSYLTTHRRYLKFTFPVLGLIFDVPGTPKFMQLCGKQPVEERSQDASHDVIVLSDDNLAIHYATAELDSVPVVRRLYSHGFTLNYLYSNPDSIHDWLLNWLRLSPLCSVQSVQMAKCLLDDGISIEPHVVEDKLFDPLEYFAGKQDRVRDQIFPLLLDRVVDQGGGERLRVAWQGAILGGHVKALRLLLGKGWVDINNVSIEIPDMNLICRECHNALQAAAAAAANDTAANMSNLEVIRLLLDQGADVNIQGGWYGNALQAAVFRGKVDVSQLLLDKGANVHAQGGLYGNALQAAAAGYYGSIGVTRLLLHHGAVVNAQGGEYGTPLQAAAHRRNVEVTQILLDKGADVHAQGGKYGNALQAAVAGYKSNLKVIQLLLDQGADVNAHGGEYGSALQAAVHYRNVEAIQLLLGKGADIHVQGGKYGCALQAAVAGYFVPTLTLPLLLDQGADVNAQGGEYGTPLQAAAYRGYEAVIQSLLDKGADIHAHGGIYGNALQAAAAGDFDSMGVTRLLLDQGADVNAQGGQYGNALQAAAYHGNIEVIQMLLVNGADVHTQGGMFGTVLQAAAYRGNIGAIQLLLDNGANVNARAGKYGAALEKVLALTPPGTCQKIPGDIPLLVELLQDHAPSLLEHVPESEYHEIAKQFVNKDRCDLDVFRELLKSRGWAGEAQGKLETEEKLCKGENEDGNKEMFEDERQDGIKDRDGVETEISPKLQQGLLEAPLENGLKAMVHVWKLFGFIFFLVFLLYAFTEFWGV